MQLKLFKLAKMPANRAKRLSFGQDQVQNKAARMNGFGYIRRETSEDAQ